MLLAALSAAGCGGESASPGPGQAQVRVVNGVQALGRVDVWIGSDRVAAGLPFTGQSVPVAVPTGARDWNLARPGEATPIASGRLTLAPGTRATVLLTGDRATLRATVAKDDPRPPASGKFRVRFADL